MIPIPPDYREEKGRMVSPYPDPVGELGDGEGRSTDLEDVSLDILDLAASRLWGAGV